MRPERDELRLRLPLSIGHGSAKPEVARSSPPAYLGVVFFWKRFAVFALIGAGCAPSPETGQLRIRAAYDMSCGGDDIHWKALGDDVYDVEGCAKHAKYAWICSGHGPMSPCKWVRYPEAKPVSSAR